MARTALASQGTLFSHTAVVARRAVPHPLCTVEARRTLLQQQCPLRIRTAVPGALGRARRSVVQPQAAAQPAAGDPHAGHAMMHDFCMTIPYGAIALVSGALALAFRAPAVGLQLLAAGVVVSLCSVLSLRAWKSGSRSTPFTLICAGASGFIAAQMWQLVVASVAPVPSGILLGLSGALAAFCAYNIIAGGNPPPKKRDAA